MLKEIYKFVTPWAKSNKIEILKNRILGKITNNIYPIYCKLIKINKNKSKRTGVIVSLTTYPARIGALYPCLNSLLRQTINAEKVILWLAKTQFPNGEKDISDNILSLKKYGLCIRFCDDIKSYKKIFYTAKEYKQNIIVTADDDTLYPEDWLENLLKEHDKYPNCVICYRAHEINIQSNKITPYKSWNLLSKDIKGPSKKLIAIGVGGILYPKNFFEDITLDFKVIMELAPTTDDLWLKIIAVKKQIDIVKVFENSKEWFTIPSTQKTSLKKINVEEGNNNDISFRNLMEFYNVKSGDFI